MPPARLPVSDNELDVLRVLWDAPGATLGEIHAQLAERYEYTTAQTMLDRLVQKGVVTRDAKTRPARHRAAVSRAKALKQYLGLVLEKIAGSPGPLVLELLKSQPLPADELAEIRRLIDEASQQSPSQQPPAAPPKTKDQP
jgi:BlaI family transcriptional regulator, penicillinase repressor